VRQLLIRKINCIGIRFGQSFVSSVTIRNDRNTHKLFKYDVAVTKLNYLIVFIVICTDNFWKTDMEQFYNTWNETQDIKTEIKERFCEQLNVMRTIHLQQLDHILNLNEWHTTRNTSMLWESRTLNALYIRYIMRDSGSKAWAYTNANSYFGGVVASAIWELCCKPTIYCCFLLKHSILKEPRRRWTLPILETIAFMI